MSSVPTALRASRPVAAVAARGRRATVRRAILAPAPAAVAPAPPLALAAPASAATTTYIGAAGTIDALSQQTGAPMARHSYTTFDRNVPADADMISVRSSGTWRQVANAGPG